MEDKNFKLVVANWKSNKNIDQSALWFERYFANLSYIHPRVVVTVAVPFPALLVAAHYLKSNGVDSNQFCLAVQDISPYPAGSYTGAVSVENLVGLGVRYAIVGHSERRKYFGETNQTVSQKSSLLLEANITPIICVEAENVVAQSAVLENKVRPKVIVAFDPMSAISSHTNSGAISQEKIEPVLEKVKTNFGDVPFIYGGSVNEKNVGQYTLISDGVLVGGASLDAKQFAELTTNAWVQSQN